MASSAANKFFVEPANPLKALLLGQESYDKASKSYLDQQIADMIASGTPDYNKIAALAAKGGNLPAALTLMKSGEESKAASEFQHMFAPGGALSQGGGAQSPPRSPLAALVAPPSEPTPVAVPPKAQPNNPFAAENTILGVDRESLTPIQVAQAPLVGQPGTVGGVPRRPDVPTITPNPASGQIPALIAAASNPRLPEGQRKVATTMLEHALKSSDLPPEQKDYILAVSQGEKDSFTAWTRKNKAAGATMINTAEGLEGAQLKGRIAIDQETAKKSSEAADSAMRALPLLDQVIKLADKTPGGMAGPAAAWASRAFSGLGFQVSEGMSNAELLQSVSQRLVPAVREPGPTSERELTIYLNAVPGLMQSTEGRLKVAAMTKEIAQRAVEIAKVRRRYLGSDELYDKLAELDKPIFSPENRKTLEDSAPVGDGWTTLPNGIRVREKK